MNIGIASIKRWETGTVQSASMDQALRVHLQGKVPDNSLSGNRELSLSRLKQVSRRLESLLGENFCSKETRFCSLPNTCGTRICSPSGI